MPPELLKRFLELDNQGWEHPAGEDFIRSANEILTHEAKIEELIGEKLERAWGEDASFLVGFSVFDPMYWDAQSRVGGQVDLICVRFSRFDRMATIFGTDLDRWSEKIPVLSTYLKSANFNFIDNKYLQEPYSGGEKTGTDGWTWFDRFFNWL